MKKIEAQIDDAVSISVGALEDVECVAVSSDAHDSLAVLVQRDGETLVELLKRLDKAVGQFYADSDVVDKATHKEINCSTVRMSSLEAHALTGKSRISTRHKVQPDEGSLNKSAMLLL